MEPLIPTFLAFCIFIVEVNAMHGESGNASFSETQRIPGILPPWRKYATSDNRIVIHSCQQSGLTLDHMVLLQCTSYSRGYVGFGTE